MASEKSVLGGTEPLRLSVPTETGKESDEAALDLAFNRRLDRGQDVALWLQPFGAQCAVRPPTQKSLWRSCPRSLQTSARPALGHATAA
jgi:hypothetical protein